MAVLHTVSVRSTNPGGRLYCGIDENNIRVNGEFGFLGEYADSDHGLLDGQTQIKVFAAPSQIQINKGLMPVVIMQPEVMYDDNVEYSTRLDLMNIKEKTPFACVQLEERDRIKVSMEVFDVASHNNPAHLAVGQCFELKQDETVLENKGNDAAVAQNHVYFKIVNIEDSRSRSARIGGQFMNDSYKLYTLEVRVKRA